MSEHDLTQDTPSRSGSGRLKNLNASRAASAARDKARALESADNIKREKERQKRCAQFGWSDAQFAEYWLLRDVPAPDKNSPLGFSLRKSQYDLLIDRMRKRLEAPPRRNANVKGMTPTDAVEHRNAQFAKNSATYRAKKAALREIEAAVAGDRPLSDDELAKIEALEATPAVAPTELDEMLASLRAAEAREGK